MGPRAAREKFPQLSRESSGIKFVRASARKKRSSAGPRRRDTPPRRDDDEDDDAKTDARRRRRRRRRRGPTQVQVFYEAMHDDARTRAGRHFETTPRVGARVPGERSRPRIGRRCPRLHDRDDAPQARTNLAIALTAASKGAAIANYCEAAGFLSEDGRVVGANVVDRVAGDAFEVRAKAVVFCGGPFTDALRNLEAAAVSNDPPAPAVRGASGTHVVLPGYYCPRDMGLLDYNTSDGRFLFFLPWLGHALVRGRARAGDAVRGFAF